MSIQTLDLTNVDWYTLLKVNDKGHKCPEVEVVSSGTKGDLLRYQLHHPLRVGSQYLMVPLCQCTN